MTNRSGRLLTSPQLVSIAVALAAVIAAVIALVVVVPPAVRAASPDIPVRAYLRALTLGEVPKALKLGQITAPAGSALLTTDAYAKASDRPTSFRVTSTTISGTTATIVTRIVQGKTSYSARFTTVRGSGLPGLAPWSLAPQQLPRMTVGVTGPPSARVTVDGVTVAATNGTLTQPVLPGTYAVAVKSTAAYTASARTVTVLLGQPDASANLAVSLTAAGKAEVKASAQAWLARCASSSVLDPSGCPFRALPMPGITYSAGQWTITTQPTLAVGGWSSAAGGWQVATSVPGSVTFTSHAVEGDEYGTASTGPHDFVIAGTAVVSGSRAAFVPSPSYASSTGGGTA